MIKNTYKDTYGDAQALKTMCDTNNILQYNKTESINDYYIRCMEAVKKNGGLLQYVDGYMLNDNDYYNLCMTAAGQNGDAIEYIDFELLKNYDDEKEIT